MTQHMCDLCGVRQATVRVAVLQDGKRRQIEVCDYHYAQLTRHQRQISPLESLFRGGLLDDLFGTPTQTQHRATGAAPQSAALESDGVNLQLHFSDQAKEILQRAAECAVQFGRREVDTEHLLHELVDSEAVQRILGCAESFRGGPQGVHCAACAPGRSGSETRRRRNRRIAASEKRT